MGTSFSISVTVVFSTIEIVPSSFHQHLRQHHHERAWVDLQNSITIGSSPICSSTARKAGVVVSNSSSATLSWLFSTWNCWKCLPLFDFSANYFPQALQILLQATFLQFLLTEQYDFKHFTMLYLYLVS